MRRLDVSVSQGLLTANEQCCVVVVKQIEVYRQAMLVQSAVCFALGSALVAKQIAVGLVIMSYVWVVGISVTDNPMLVSCIAKEVSIDDVRFGCSCRILVFGVESA